jgi:hypothetical protein
MRVSMKIGVETCVRLFSRTEILLGRFRQESECLARELQIHGKILARRILTFRLYLTYHRRRIDGLVYIRRTPWQPLSKVRNPLALN